MIPLSLGGSSTPEPLNPAAPAALLVTRDLMIESRVVGSGTPLGVRVLAVSDVRQGLQTADPGVKLILFDLSLGTDGLSELVGHWQLGRRVPVLAFGSHVATALLEAARSAGCHEVFPRSRLHGQLTEILREYAFDCEA